MCPCSFYITFNPLFPPTPISPQFPNLPSDSLYLVFFHSVNRTVKREEGEELARKLNCAFTEASAKHNDNVASAFQLVVIEIEKELNPESAKTTSSGKETWGSWFKGMFGTGSGTSPSST